MDVNNLTKEEIIEILYPTYLEREIEKRDNAIAALKNKDYKGCWQSHYGYSKREFVTLDSTELEDVKRFLNSFVLPENGYNASVCTQYDDDGETSEIGIEYSVCFTEPIEKCASLAKHWASQDAWQLIYQPTHKKNIPLRKLIEKILNVI